MNLGTNHNNSVWHIPELNFYFFGFGHIMFGHKFELVTEDLSGLNFKGRWD